MVDVQFATRICYTVSWPEPGDKLTCFLDPRFVHIHIHTEEMIAGYNYDVHGVAGELLFDCVRKLDGALNRDLAGNSDISGWNQRKYVRLDIDDLPWSRVLDG